MRILTAILLALVLTLSAQADTPEFDTIEYRFIENVSSILESKFTSAMTADLIQKGITDDESKYIIRSFSKDVARCLLYSLATYPDDVFMNQIKEIADGVSPFKATSNAEKMLQTQVDTGLRTKSQVIEMAKKAELVRVLCNRQIKKDMKQRTRALQ